MTVTRKNQVFVIQYKANGHFYAVETNRIGRVSGRSDRLTRTETGFGNTEIKFVVDRDEAEECFQSDDYDIMLRIK